MREDMIYLELGDIVNYAIGGDWGKDPSYEDDNFDVAYCIRGTELRTWKENFGKSAAIRKLKKNNIVKRNLKEGDIIVEISGGGPEQPVGRTEVITKTVLNNFPDANVVCTNFLRLIRLNEEVSPRYVNHFLKFFYSTGEIIKYQAGSNNLRNLKFNDYLTISIPLCPLPEQRAIVSKIEALFSSLDQGIADLKKAQDKLKIYRQAVLKKAFEGELTREWRGKNKCESANDFLKSISKHRKEHPFEKGSIYHKKLSPDFNFRKDPKIDTWSEGTLDKLIYIAARIGWRGLKKSEYIEDGPLFLSVHSLNHGKHVDYNEAFHLPRDRYEESPEIQLLEGDVLLCKDGAGIGKIGIVKDLPREATVNSSVLVIRGMEILSQEFIYYLFSGPGLQSIVAERITGSTTPHLFQNDIRKFKLSIPPKEEQEQIVQEIESRLSVCDKVEQSIEESLVKAEALRPSILKKAFEGKLLTEAEIEKCKQAPDYEPASVLLEKIRGEKVKS